MKQWRRAVLAALVAGSMAIGGPALANGNSDGKRQDGDRPSQPTAPPETDPTCESETSETCPGDSGNDGGAAGDRVPCNAGTELARDILLDGAEDGAQCD